MFKTSFSNFISLTKQYFFELGSNVSSNADSNTNVDDNNESNNVPFRQTTFTPFRHSTFLAYQGQMHERSKEIIMPNRRFKDDFISVEEFAHDLERELEYDYNQTNFNFDYNYDDDGGGGEIFVNPINQTEDVITEDVIDGESGNETENNTSIWSLVGDKLDVIPNDDVVKWDVGPFPYCSGCKERACMMIYPESAEYYWACATQSCEYLQLYARESSNDILDCGEDCALGDWNIDRYTTLRTILRGCGKSFSRTFWTFLHQQGDEATFPDGSSVRFQNVVFLFALPILLRRLKLHN